MKKVFSYTALVSIFMLASLTVFADEAPPPKIVKSMRSTMRIQVAYEENAKEARLIIPQKDWKKLRAEIDGNDSLNAANRFGLTRTQTVMTGLFLSLAFVFGGVWIVRNRGTNKNKVVIGIAFLAVCGAIATVSFANIAPPRISNLNDSILSEAVREDGTSGAIKIEVVDGTYYDSITLILPKRERK